MKLFLFFLRHSPKLISSSVLLGLCGGGATAALMALISEKLAGANSSFTRSWIFAALVLIVLLANYASRIVMLHLSQRVIYDLRMDLCLQVSAVPLRRIEEVGGSRIVAVLSEDINVITTMLINMPSVFVNLSILLACVVYLGWLSPALLLGFLVFLGLAVATTKLPEKRAFNLMLRARASWDALMYHFLALTDGLKELKLHQPRRQAFFAGPLESAAVSYRENRLAGARIYAATSSWGQVLLFLFLGIILFERPLTADIEHQNLTGFLLTVIYLRGPIVILLDMAPLLMQAGASLRKVEDLGLSLTNLVGRETMVSWLPPPAPCERIDLVGIVHNYDWERKDQTFLLGPLDLTIRGGELIFLVGGNGSGKTTLIKLLAALYLPDAGELRYNGEPVTNENREWYRQHFTVVFYDFFLFGSFLGLELAGFDAAAQNYLRRLQLDHKVRVENGELSTMQLSQGQRRRLALLTAYLEDRPIYVFDEWAADQDPVFKEVFYLELLPELRARGKTIIVVSHDDRYYYLADRVLKLDSGRVVQEYAPGAGIPPLANDFNPSDGRRTEAL